jgi:phage shock protein A
MNVFKRINDIFSSNVNHALDKMENPSKMIRYSITQMEDTLEKAKESAAETLCTIKGREKALDEYKATETRWEVRAQMAVKEGKDELAKEAISERQKTATRIKEIEEELVTLKEISASQQAQITKLAEKLQEVKAKERTLVARAEHAKEKIEMEKQINSFDCSDAVKRFNEMEEKVERLEAEASIASQSNKVEASFVNLEQNASIEAEFKDLKAKLAK